MLLSLYTFGFGPSLKYKVHKIANFKDKEIIEIVLITLSVACFPMELKLSILSFVFCLIFLKLDTLGMEGFSFLTDNISGLLVLLTLMISYLMFFSWNKLNFIKQYTQMEKVNMLMLLVLLITFSVSTVFSFYVFFEVSLIPILLMILGWGGQPERLKASFFLVLYTITASLPLLLLILMLSSDLGSFHSMWFLTFNTSYACPKSFQIFLILGFLVKFPMFLLHLWLPKAHVEAPVMGSMILAGILLKLGGYGLIRLSFFLKTNLIIKFIEIFAIVGGGLISILCLRQKDLKILIAYSSISHMAMVITACLLKISSLMFGALIMMIAHGIASSGLFSLANSFYERSHSRSMFINSGMLSIFPLMAFFWFILCLSNMGGPFTINMICEIILISWFSAFNVFLIPWVMALAFFAVAYSLMLYTTPFQPQNMKFNLMGPPLKTFENDLFTLHALFLFMPIFLLFLSN